MIFFWNLIVILFSGLFSQDPDPVDFVNPYLGGIPHPKFTQPTFPYIGLPHGMIRIYPPRGDFTTDFLTGIPLCNSHFKSKAGFYFFPQQGTDSSLSSSIDYSFDLERIMPYNYSVYLDESQIEVSLAVTTHAVIEEFKFEQNQTCFFVIRTGGEISVEMINEKVSCVFGRQEQFFFYLIFENAPDGAGELPQSVVSYKKDTFKSHGSSVAFNFGEGPKAVKFKYGISTISVENAKENLNSEIINYNISDISEKGRDAWLNVMNKYNVSGGIENEKRLFWTSIYRTYESITLKDLRINNEIKSVYVDPFVSSSYESLHPLLGLTDPNMEVSFINHLIDGLEARSEVLKTNTEVLKKALMKGSLLMNDLDVEEREEDINVNEYDFLFSLYRIPSLLLSAHSNHLPNISFSHSYEVLQTYHNLMMEYAELEETRVRRLSNDVKEEEKEKEEDNNNNNSRNNKLRRRLLSSPRKHEEMQHWFYVRKGYFPFIDRNKEERERVQKKLLSSLPSSSSSSSSSSSFDEFLRVTKLLTSSFERASQSVSLSIAASYSDYCMAELLERLKEINTPSIHHHHHSNFLDLASVFRSRSRNYQTLFNPETLVFEPKDDNNEFVSLSRPVQELVGMAINTHTKRTQLLENGYIEEEDEKVKINYELTGTRTYLTNPYVLPFNINDTLALFAEVAQNRSGNVLSKKEARKAGRALLLSHVNELLNNPPRHPQFDHLNFIPREYIRGDISNFPTTIDPPLSFYGILNENKVINNDDDDENDQSRSKYRLGEIVSNWKFQKQIRNQVSLRFRNDLEGISQDYDGGNMFSSNVMSALGFYPKDAFSYNLGSPWFSNVIIKVGSVNQNTFTVKANNWNFTNKYISSATLNDVAYTQTQINNDQIQNGGTLVLNMKNKPY